jgi:hypothetical protein
MLSAPSDGGLYFDQETRRPARVGRGSSEFGSCPIARTYTAGARFATDGGSKIRLTRRLPQRGHILRSRKPESDILRPRVQGISSATLTTS